MLKSAEEHLAALRDGRKVYVGDELILNVTSHPAFRNGAKTLAALYDLKRHPEQRETLSYEENGERFGMYFLMPRSRQDLERRTRAHKRIADATHGLFGRSPDHVASFVTGMALQADVLDEGRAASEASPLTSGATTSTPARMTSISPMPFCRLRGRVIRSSAAGAVRGAPACPSSLRRTMGLS